MLPRQHAERVVPNYQQGMFDIMSPEACTIPVDHHFLPLQELPFEHRVKIVDQTTSRN